MESNHFDEMYDGDSSDGFDVDEYIRTDEDYLDEINNDITKDNLDGNKLIELIVNESLNKGRKSEKKIIFSIFNFKIEPEKIVKLVNMILKNNFENLSNQKKTSLIMFLNNYFDKISNNLQTFDKNRNNESILNLDKNNIEMKIINLFRITRLPELYEIMIKLTELLQTDKEVINYKFKMYIKDIIKFIIIISDNKKGTEICNLILSNIYKQISENYENCLEEQILLNFLNIYECVITSRSDLIYDNENFENSLFLFEFIFNSIDSIKLQNKLNIIENQNLKYLKDNEIEEFKISIVRKNKIEFLKNVVFTFINFINNNLDILKRTKSITNNCFFINNIKLLKIIEYILYLNFDTLSLGSFIDLVKFEKTEKKLINVKLLVIKTLKKIIIKFISDYEISSNNPNLNIFLNKLFQDLIKCIGEMNKEFNFSLIKDANFDEIEFNSYFNSILKLITNLLNLNGPKELFKSNQIEIYRLFLMPLLKISIVEKESFFIDAAEYVKHIWDFTFQFKSNFIKAKAFKLLLRLCEIFDDFTQFLGLFYTELLIYTIKNENYEVNFDFKFQYIVTEDPDNIFIQSLNNYNKEEILENIFQILAVIHERLYISNRKLFNYIDNLFIQIFPNFIQNESSEFIRSKICIFCYSNVRIKLKDFTNENNETNLVNFSNQFYQKDFIYLTFILENIFYSIDQSKNFALNYLSIELINELLFYKSFMKHSWIKNFFASSISLHMNKFQKIFTSGDKLEINSNSLFNELIVKLAKNYFNELESDMFILFNHIIIEISKEIERYYKIINSSLNSKSNIQHIKTPVKYNSTKSNLDFIQALYEIVKSCNNTRNNILKMNIINKYVEVILTKSNKMLNFNYEEDLMKINILVLQNITTVNEKLYNSLIKEYFREIKNQKFDIKSYHLDFLLQIMDLILSESNFENILNYKKEAHSLFNLGITYYHKKDSICLNSHLYITTFMINFILNFSSFNKNILDLTDYKMIFELLIDRVKSKSKELNSGPLASRIFLLFHLICIILFQENNLQNFINKNTKLFEFMLDKTLTLCEDHPSANATSITIIFLFRIISILINNNLNDENNFNMIVKLMEFTIQQLTFLTFKNLQELNKDKIDLEKTFKGNEITNSNDINKKFFGKKNITKVQNLADECNIKNKNKKNEKESSDSSIIDDDENISNQSEEELEEYLSDGVYINSEDDSSLFLRDLEKEEDLKLFNQKMTAENYLKRKKLEYEVKFVIIIYLFF